jgi:hypothetical protein
MTGATGEAGVAHCGASLVKPVDVRWTALGRVLDPSDLNPWKI